MPVDNIDCYRRITPLSNTLYDRMRDAADVMDEVNARFRKERPMAGITANEPISASSMRYLADDWERRDD